MVDPNKIKELRNKNNLTLDDVAKYLEIAKQTVFKYETGVITNIPLDKLEKLATLFGVEPWELAGWEKPAIIDDSELLEDPMNREILRLAENLTPEEKKMFRAQLKGYLDNR